MLDDLVLPMTSVCYRRHAHRCSLCGTEDLEAFGIKGVGLQSYCRECNKAYQKTWYRLAKASGKR